MKKAIGKDILNSYNEKELRYIFNAYDEIDEQEDPKFVMDEDVLAEVFLTAGILVAIVIGIIIAIIL